MTTGKDEGYYGGSSDSRSDGMTLLFDIDTTVPSSPGLEGSEHATFTTHVTEGTLTTSVGS